MGAGRMSFHHVELRSAYADSVTLLQVSRAVQDLTGVVAAQVAMATPLNVDVLIGMGFEVPAEATTNDLVVALHLDDADGLPAALAGVEQALAAAVRRPTGPTDLAPPRTTAAALRGAPGAIAVVSVPGPSALVEAMDAVDAGHDVMIFSDNVPVEQELALKQAAAQRGVLVMGPDCGTAVVDGVGLGFANVVEPGPVGIVAASGTGCQQVLALLDHAGVGVSSALGVGGRDLSSEIGGLATREALRRLDADPEVELIVLISKPPAPEVATAIEEYAAGLATPVELALLGAGRPDLTEATEQVLRRLGWGVPDWPVVHQRGWIASTGHGYLRGLFVGGTLAGEARLIASDGLGTVGSDPDDLATGHAVVDFGDDALTTGRAHPMIDPTVRLQHLAQVAADPATDVILLDVVLGHGAEPDPAATLVPALEGIGKLVVVTVVGTTHDPQDRTKTVAALTDTGAEVYLSNAEAARAALRWTGRRA
jgi:FdrA protein